MLRLPSSRIAVGMVTILAFALMANVVSQSVAPDSDGDGLPDMLETQFGLNPQIKDNDIFGDSRLFAMQQMRDFYGREGTTSEIDQAANAISLSGVSRAASIDRLISSGEHADVVGPMVRLYAAYFLRLPDQQGLDFWVAQYRSHLAGTGSRWSFAEVSNFFATSPEFNQRYGQLDNGAFVDLVYRNVLNRFPDAAGRAFWVEELNSGRRSRGSVMSAFSEAPENKLLKAVDVSVVAIHFGMLKRMPGTVAFDNWVSQIRASGNRLPLIEEMLAASEYRERFLAPGIPIGTDPPVSPTPGTVSPPANAKLSRAYKEMLDRHYSDNPPRAGECSREIHGRYWVYGPDSKVYPTWHPPVDPVSGCAFGHEHGADPSTSYLRSVTLPFGYTNEKLFELNSVNYRDEDHVGHKVELANNMPMGGNGSLNGARCDVLIKFHQGTHSRDALANNLHEVFYNASCTDGTAMRWRSLHPFGEPGKAFVNCTPGSSNYEITTGSAVPATSPIGNGSRNLPDNNCLTANLIDMQEDWPIDVAHSLNNGRFVFGFGLYLTVGNASRFVDLSTPGAITIGRPTERCYQLGTPAANSPECVALRMQGAIAWNDPRSPWKGTARRIHVNQLTVVNPTGITRWYTDVFGGQVSRQPDTARGIVLEQFINGDNSAYSAFEGGQLVNDYSHPTVHAPN